MRTKLLYLFITITLFTLNASAQLGKKKYYAALEKLKVLSCKSGSHTFTVGDTVSLGFPFGQRDKFSFIMRRTEYFDILSGQFDIEKLKMEVNWSNKSVILNAIYYDKDRPTDGCSLEFPIAKDLYGWIMTDNAIKSKEIVKLNSKEL